MTRRTSRAPIPRTSRTARVLQDPALPRTAAKVEDEKALKKGAKMRSDEDEQGSYTGINSKDKFEKPVQDADDL